MAVLICVYGAVFGYAMVSQQLSCMWNDNGGSRRQETWCTFYCDAEYMDRGSGLSVKSIIREWELFLRFWIFVDLQQARSGPD
jgi:hypothetical protein